MTTNGACFVAKSRAEVPMSITPATQARSARSLFARAYASHYRLRFHDVGGDPHAMNRLRYMGTRNDSSAFAEPPRVRAGYLANAGGDSPPVSEGG